MGEVLLMKRGGVSAYAFLIVNYPQGATCNCTNTSGSKDITIDSSAPKKLFYVSKPSSGTSITCEARIEQSGKETKTRSVEFSSEGQSQEITMSFEYLLSLNRSDWDKTSGNMQQREEDGAIGFYAATGGARAYLTIPFSILGYTKLNIVVDTESTNNSTIGLSDGQPAGSKEFAASKTFNSGSEQIDLTELDNSKTYYLMWSFSAQKYAYITSAYLS